VVLFGDFNKKNEYEKRKKKEDKKEKIKQKERKKLSIIDNIVKIYKLGS